MIDSPTDIARRLRRDARVKLLVTRYWAGWRLELTFGPYERAFDPVRAAAAAATAAALYEQVHGAPAPTVDLATSIAAQKDVWHLSASWRGGEPVEAGREMLAALIVALGVPADRRDGTQPMRVLAPGGAQSPQVTHWIWRGG